jgi:Holliday junction resolvase-like predicted endonuclease
MTPPGPCPPGSGDASCAAQYWLAGHPEFSGHDIAFDVVLAAPWGFPRYIANAFPV